MTDNFQNNCPKFKLVFYISIVSFLIKIACIFLFVDIQNPQMWEFGEIARNLLSGYGYQFKAVTINVPSAFMPPGLPFLFYLFFYLFGDNPTAYVSILIFNCILSSVSAIILFLLSKKLYDDRTAVYSLIYSSFSPIIIFSTISFNSVVIYQILITLMYLYFNKIQSLKSVDIKNHAYTNTSTFGVITGIFMYFRAEMLGLMLIIFLLLLLCRRIKLSFLYLLISLIIIAPWTIRNYITFGEFVPITTTFGYNILMGHGSSEPSAEYLIEINALKEDSTFETKRSEIALRTAVREIKSRPYEEAKGIFRKLYWLWVVDNYSELAKHPLYLSIWLPTLLLFIVGLYFSFKSQDIRRNLLFPIIYIIFSSLLVIIFFNLPRYQVQMSFILIPTAMYGLSKLLNYNTKIKK